MTKEQDSEWERRSSQSEKERKQQQTLRPAYEALLGLFPLGMTCDRPSVYFSNTEIRLISEAYISSKYDQLFGKIQQQRKKK